MTLKKIICMLLAAVFVCIVSACGVEKCVQSPEVTGKFTFTALSIGKADAILLETENHTVLIDTGEKGDGKNIIRFLTEKGIEHLDYLFITHFDQDHVGGAAKVMDKKAIGEIIVPKYQGTSNEYKAFTAMLEEKEIVPTYLDSNMSFVLDDVLFEVYPPMRSSYSEDNDYSIVISARHGNNTFLFTGDAEDERLSEISKQLSLPHTVLKIPHHGAYSKKTESFIDAVKPEYAVITCSSKKPADEKIINLLEKIECEVYSTETDNVVLVSDGEKILIDQ